MMDQISLAQAWTRNRIEQIRRGTDSGLTTVEWVVLVGVLVIAALTVTGIVIATTTGAARDIVLQ